MTEAAIGFVASTVRKSLRNRWKRMKKGCKGTRAVVVINMGMSNLHNKIRHNHLLMMVVCCIIPLALLYIAVYSFGISRSYLYWLIILLCPLMHVWMMRDMHKKGSHKDNKRSEGSCH
jgi:Flp pilus assembly protein TadB